MKDSTVIGLGIVAVIAGIGTCGVINHTCEGSKKTREIATLDYVLDNYRWFKNQSAAIDQVNAQVKSAQGEIELYKHDFEGTPRADWPFDAREELARKEAVLRGYTSQFNLLAKDYNARSSDLTKKFAEGEEPKELEPYLGKTYAPVQ